MPLTSRPPLRILYLSTSVNNGGADRHGVEIATASQKQGWSPRFLCVPGSFTDALCVDATLMALRDRVDVQIDAALKE